MLSSRRCVAAVSAATVVVLSIVAQLQSASAQVRAASVSDVDGTYTSIFKLDPSCPSKIVIAGTSGANKGVGSTPVQNIVEDGDRCSGGTMYTVTETVAKTPQYLENAGFSDVPGRLKSNPAATATVFGQYDIAETLVGFDDRPRTCGGKSYDKNTFWFFIKESGDQDIRIRTKERVVSETIPRGKKGLFITTTDGRLCILTADTDLPTSTPEETADSSTESTSESPGAESESASPSDDDDDDGSACFPSDSTVELASGRKIPMHELTVGDSVRTGPSSFSDVIMFTHRHATVRSSFIKLTTVDGAVITLSPTHYIHVGHHGRLVPAANVRLGDELLLASTRRVSPVVQKEVVRAQGLYNPQTVDGDIVVDNVISSTYTTAVHPALAHHALLAPIRWVYKANLPGVRAVLASVFKEGSPVAASFLPSGPQELVL